MRYVIGIDPGLGNSGVVLRLADEQVPLEAACYRNEHVGEWDVVRATSIIIPAMETMLAWINKYDIEEVEIVIETPFLNRNPAVLMCQMYLFVLFQASVYDYLVPLVPKVFLTICHNATSKSKLAHTKGATKSQMIAASPWANYKEQGLTHNQAHTLADAYAHTLSAYTEHHALHELPQYMVAPNYTTEEDTCDAD